MRPFITQLLSFSVGTIFLFSYLLLHKEHFLIIGSIWLAASVIVGAIIQITKATETTIPITTMDISRIEVIGLDGREFTHKLDQSSYYKLSLQDNGRTLKLFKTLKEKQC